MYIYIYLSIYISMCIHIYPRVHVREPESEQELCESFNYTFAYAYLMCFSASYSIFYFSIYARNQHGQRTSQGGIRSPKPSSAAPPLALPPGPFPGGARSADAAAARALTRGIGHVIRPASRKNQNYEPHSPLLPLPLLGAVFLPSAMTTGRRLAGTAPLRKSDRTQKQTKIVVFYARLFASSRRRLARRRRKPPFWLDRPVRAAPDVGNGGPRQPSTGFPAPSRARRVVWSASVDGPGGQGGHGAAAPPPTQKKKAPESFRPPTAVGGNAQGRGTRRARGVT